MTQMSDDEVESVDLAAVAYREDGEWYVADLPPRALDSVAGIGQELRRYPGDGGALALISVDEDFLLMVRSQGAHLRVLLSDATAATDWVLARSAVDHIGVPVEDDDDPAPGGDLGIVDDLGCSASDMGELIDDLLDDEELLPDEVLSDIADRLGFGVAFDDLVGLSPA